MSTTQTTSHYSEAITLTITVHATTSVSTTEGTTHSTVSAASGQEVPATCTPPTPAAPTASPMPARRALLTQRALLVLMLAFVIGTGIGALTFTTTHDLAAAVLAGIAAAGGVTRNHDLIE